MKKTFILLNTVALFLIAGMTFSCSEIAEGNVPSGTVTLTTTVTMPQGTKALAADGTKTFAENDQIAVIYQNTSNQTVKAVSEKLSASKIQRNGKYAEFTVTLTDPKPEGSVRYIYPASMAKTTISTSTETDNDANTINYDALSSQDGTLETIAKNLDLCTFDGALSAEVNLPTNAKLTNKLAIVKFTLMNANDAAINASEFVVQVSDNNYAVVPASATSELYVAVQGFSTKKVSLFAKVGNNWYSKEQAGVTFANSQLYPITVKMNQTGILPGKFTVNINGDKVRFSQGNLRATNNTANTTTGWIWSFAEQQYNYLGDNNKPVGNNVVTEAGSVDLFCWVGASSSWEAYGINNSSENYGNVHGETLKDDWGNLAISNGGNTKNSGWRTLKSHYDNDFPLEQEWAYIFTGRTTGITIKETTDARYTAAAINTGGATKVHGYILFPDNYAGGTPDGVTWGTINAPSSWTTECTTADWISLEAAGCVFLPASGYRVGANNFGYGNNLNYLGCYWSSTSNNKNNSTSKAQQVIFNPNQLLMTPNYDRRFGLAVRLVKDAN